MCSDIYITYINVHDKNEKKLYKFLHEKKIKHGITLKKKYDNINEIILFLSNKNKYNYFSQLFTLFKNYNKINLKICSKIAKINNILLKIYKSDCEIEKYVLTASLFLVHFIWQNYNIKTSFKSVQYLY